MPRKARWLDITVFSNKEKMLKRDGYKKPVIWMRAYLVIFTYNV